MSENDKKDPPEPTSSEAPHVRPWPLLDSEVLHEFNIYRLRRDRRLSPRTGRKHTFLVLDASDWVNIVPVTPNGNVLLIRQFRHGTASAVWEIPGGMVDGPDEPAEQAARRELREETGYATDQWEFLGAVEPNPAIQNNRCHTFLARDVQLVGSQQLDGAEDIAVQETPWPRVRAMIDSGEIAHSLVILALFWYGRHLEGMAPPPAP